MRTGINTQTVADQRLGWERLVAFLNCSATRPPVSDLDCVVNARHEDLVAAIPLQVKWSPHVDGVDLTAPGPTLAAAGHLAPVPVVAGSTREDGPSNPLSVPIRPLFSDPATNTHKRATGASRYRDVVIRQQSRAWDGGERAALAGCDGVACTEADFRRYGSNMGLGAAEVAAMVAAYADPEGLENGVPDSTPGASQWYWVSCVRCEPS